MPVRVLRQAMVSYHRDRLVNEHNLSKFKAKCSMVILVHIRTSGILAMVTGHVIPNSNCVANGKGHRVINHIQGLLIPTGTFLHRRIKVNTARANQAMLVVGISRRSMLHALRRHLVRPFNPRLKASLRGAGLSSNGSPQAMRKGGLVRLLLRNALIRVGGRPSSL